MSGSMSPVRFVVYKRSKMDAGMAACWTCGTREKNRVRLLRKMALAAVFWVPVMYSAMKVIW